MMTAREKHFPGRRRTMVRLATTRLANIFGNGAIYRHDKKIEKGKTAPGAPEPEEIVRRTLRKSLQWYTVVANSRQNAETIIFVLTFGLVGFTLFRSLLFDLAFQNETLYKVPSSRKSETKKNPLLGFGASLTSDLTLVSPANGRPDLASELPLVPRVQCKSFNDEETQVGVVELRRQVN